MNLKRREFTIAMALGCIGMEASAQSSSWKPTDRITYVLGVTPGGSVDIYARGIQDALTQLNLIQGKTMLIDYKPGGAGIISLQQLQRNSGNAHWLGTFHTSTLVAIAAGMLKADLKDYPPVAMMVEETQMVAVRADSNIKSATELVTALSKDVTSLKIGVAPALGSGTHLSIAKPLKVAGVDIKNLTVAPFKASSETMGALLGGHIDVISATAPVIMPQVAAGKVRVLASASPTRGSGALAQVPTWREQGIAADFVTYNGLLLPPNMSAAQIAFWEDALRKVSQHPAWLALVEKNGGRPVYRDHAESMKYMVSEQKSINELVQELGLVSK
ncbi:MAG: tripartite tricarboxylate transporter substrate binding protein [Pseudomonadota bacterium]|jgi:putative tricarboxylic transport membrane protein|uniref:Bug family tripartite tricarboxylate transporter substrate binding protein n=1 Tax=Limnohabitans sp. 103DPR2 TaxID=1678129 RepID=UPI00070591B0|nr:tripartite tricarboxylate transporter substrate binding protein [Limnohabitans sp. 103DPR2]ALK92347.1 Tripartite tricarboxylate transporter family receptor [Limnohabitans sp. 103DPR2]MDE3231868.1 tripartite tricarboxylate transporter substrate binding protein [Pseudomonadota bacterium]